MSKKQLSIYLQNDIYSYLIDYKNKNELSNLSVAIERLILERIFNEQGNLNTNINYVKQEKVVGSKATKLLNNIKGAMPD